MKNDIKESVDELSKLKNGDDVFNSFDTLSLDDELESILGGMDNIEEHDEYASLVVEKPEPIAEVVEKIEPAVYEEKVIEYENTEPVMEQPAEIVEDIVEPEPTQPARISHNKEPEPIYVDEVAVVEPVVENNVVAVANIEENKPVVAKPKKKKRKRKLKSEIAQEREDMERGRRIREENLMVVDPETSKPVAVENKTVNVPSMDVSVTAANAVDALGKIVGGLTSQGITINISTVNINIVQE